MTADCDKELSGSTEMQREAGLVAAAVMRGQSAKSTVFRQSTGLIPEISKVDKNVTLWVSVTTAGEERQCSAPPHWSGH